MRARPITLVFAAVVGVAGGVAKADQPLTPTVPDPSVAPPPGPRLPESQRSRRTRVFHAVAVGSMTLAYGLVEFGFKGTFAPDECGWCNPPGLDRSVRDALKWDDINLAQGFSNLTGYVLQPIATLGVLAISGGKYGSRRVFDDFAPVLEAAVSVTLVNQLVKFTFGRSRPFVRFGDPNRGPSPDDNLSFFSGHTSFTFALAVSAGMVAHRRNYKLEPLIWGGGLALAATTGYMRIAGDKHYVSDVVVGAAVGSAFGFFVPQWLHDDVLGEDVNLVPTGKGVAIVGTF
jgi:membrane-associated phospholipid phosphatase